MKVTMDYRTYLRSEGGDRLRDLHHALVGTQQDRKRPTDSDDHNDQLRKLYPEGMQLFIAADDNYVFQGRDSVTDAAVTLMAGLCLDFVSEEVAVELMHSQAVLDQFMQGRPTATFDTLFGAPELFAVLASSNPEVLTQARAIIMVLHENIPKRASELAELNAA